MSLTKMVLGHSSAFSASQPAKVKSTVYELKATALIASGNTGGMFSIVANNGPSGSSGRDTNGVYGTGFKLTDFLSPNLISQYDYYRIVKVEYVGTLENIPRQSVPNVHVYSSVDWDNASVNNFPEFMERPNKALSVFSTTVPTQRLLELVPRRRISSNADPSLQIVPNPSEWVDCAYASSIIFGNVKFGIYCPDGQVQYSNPADPASVQVVGTIWVEFKGRITA